ncbi:MAG: FUSC family protein, partial [Solirubrobacterales bacterium]|nr:FUSC family protein [Solirubrobacterales bacterium]
IALVLVLWRAHAHLPERAAIAKLYRALAAWVRDPSDVDHHAPVLLALNGAREAIDAAEGRLAVPTPAGEAFRVLVDEADQTRLDVIALRNAREKIETWDTGIAIRAFALGRAAGADALAAVADALEACRWRADAASLQSRLDMSVDALREEFERRSAAGDVDHADELEAVLHRTASIRGEMRSAVDLATSWQGEGTPPEDPVRRKRSRRPELGVHPPWSVLRANLTLSSSAFRHAVRLSITIALAATIYRAFDLPRGYWVPLTVIFVLRPDYGSTFTRGLQRYVGTALGAVLATLIAAALNPGPYALAALATVLAVAIFAFLYANYALFTVSMTAWIIFLVAFGGIPESATAIDRLIDTAIGATLTLAVYALWPTWERSKLPDTTAALIEADRVYVHSLFESWFDRAGPDSEAVRSARARARVARTNAEASVQRALFEPTGNQVGFGTADATGLLASLRRFADGALALEAHLEEDRPPIPPEARTIAGELDTALAELASAMRDRRHPVALPSLRETQQALARRVGREAPLAEETDRIVNSITVAAHVLDRSTTPLSEVTTSATAP